MLLVQSIDLFNGLDMLFSFERCHVPLLPGNFFAMNLRDIPIIDINEGIFIIVLNMLFVDYFGNLRDPNGS
jgi:hypothetical protein